jgi:hypothetical protein
MKTYVGKIFIVTFRDNDKQAVPEVDRIRIQHKLIRHLGQDPAFPWVWIRSRKHRVLGFESLFFIIVVCVYTRLCKKEVLVLLHN